MPGAAPYHHGNLKAAAIEVAAEVLERDGEAKVTLRNVAERVGVTHRALYRHFPDRDALMAEVASRTLLAMHAHLEAATEAVGEDPQAQLTATIEAYVEFGLRHPSVYRQAFTAGFAKRSAHPGLAAAAKTLGKAFTALVEGYAPRREDAVSAADDAIALWGFLHGLIDLYWGGSLRARSPEAAKRYILAQVLRWMP